MAASDAGECRSCKAPVIWTLTKDGAKAPIDVEGSRDGTVLVLRQSGLGVLSIVLSQETLDLARRGGVTLRKNHYATCPDKQEWRERTDAKREATVGG